MDEFELSNYFGYAYFAYCQVGRHIIEILQANDMDLPEAHVQPYNNFSANTILWFGGDIGHREKVLRKEMLQKKFESHPVFQKMKLQWEDPKLAIGRVSVGRLIDMPYTDKDRLALISKISNFQKIQKIELE